VQVIAGHHPHVVQPLELFDRGLCLYSGGNVVGPAIALAWPCRLFVALEAALEVQGPDAGELAGYRVHPFVQLRERGRTRIVGLGELSGRRAGRFRRRLGALFDLDEP
jgi:poly-gamma-glutamate synthesis protein (capsule biosynthesis protein)